MVWVDNRRAGRALAKLSLPCFEEHTDRALSTVVGCVAQASIVVRPGSDLILNDNLFLGSQCVAVLGSFTMVGKQR